MNVGTAKELGDSVRAVRLRRGLTQQVLASRAGMSRQWLAGLESGTANPTWDVVSRLAAALQVDVTFHDRTDVTAPTAVVQTGTDDVPTVDLDAVLAAHQDGGGRR